MKTSHYVCFINNNDDRDKNKKDTIGLIYYLLLSSKISNAFKIA